MYQSHVKLTRTHTSNIYLYPVVHDEYKNTQIVQKHACVYRKLAGHTCQESIIQNAHTHTQLTAHATSNQ